MSLTSAIHIFQTPNPMAYQTQNREGKDHRQLRLRWVTIVMLLALVVVAGRLIQLTMTQGEELQERAHNQHVVREPLPGVRGTIYDRDGIALARDHDSVCAFVSPNEVKPEERDQVADMLAGLLDISRERIYATLLRDSYFSWLSRQLEDEEVLALREADLPGVYLREESARLYPLGETSAHLLGFVGVDNQGLEGLELVFDEKLTGEDGWILRLRDATGRILYPLGESGQAPRRGNDVYLTIDSRYQHIVERELARAVEKHNALGGMAVLMDPANGDLLALANYPTFDPNNYGDYHPSVWRNRVITDIFEPGSTMKSFTVAGALESGLVTPETVFDTPEATMVTGARIKDSLPHASQLTVTEIIERSSNVGALQIGLEMGRERLYQTLIDFGFGEPTEVGLPGEVGGLLRPAEKWYPLDTACASFGQGIAVTPIQLVTAYAAIANGGILVKPRLVLREENSEALVSQEEIEVQRRVVSAETARQLREILIGTVDHGLSMDAGNSGYLAAGKTGTAEKIGAEGYLDRRYIASFVGFAPANDPRLVLLVIVDEPNPIYGGGPVCGPAFSRIIRQVLALEGVPAPGALTARLVRAETPELLRAAPRDGETTPIPLGLNARQAAALLSATGATASLYGSGTIKAVVGNSENESYTVTLKRG